MSGRLRLGAGPPDCGRPLRGALGIGRLLCSGSPFVLGHAGLEYRFLLGAEFPLPESRCSAARALLFSQPDVCRTGGAGLGQLDLERSRIVSVEYAVTADQQSDSGLYFPLVQPIPTALFLVPAFDQAPPGPVSLRELQHTARDQQPDFAQLP